MDISVWTLAAALALAGPAPALATLQFAFATSDGGSFACHDQQNGCDLNPLTGGVLSINETVGGIFIEGTFASSQTSPDELSFSNLTITNETGAPIVLTMAAGATGFTAPVSSILSSASITGNTNAGEPFALGFWADHANGQGAPGTPGINLFNVNGTFVSNPDSASGTHLDAFGQPSGVFSMTEGAQITLAGGASITGFNQSMAAGVVPEPATWGMVIAGFLALGMVGWRRKQQPRFAI